VTERQFDALGVRYGDLLKVSSDEGGRRTQKLGFFKEKIYDREGLKAIRIHGEGTWHEMDLGYISIVAIFRVVEGK